jgi:hypothetical protein
MESTRYFLPRDPLSVPNVRSDLFALGSSMYYIMAGHEPYNDSTEDEVTDRYVRGEFPDVDSFECGRAIEGCWTGELGSAQEVVDAFIETTKI